VHTSRLSYRVGKKDGKLSWRLAAMMLLLFDAQRRKEKAQEEERLRETRKREGND
jgi:hypothetical protein